MVDLREINERHLGEWRATLDRDGKPARSRFVADVIQSYWRIYGTSICGVLRSAPRPDRLRHCSVLEIGFGTGIGIEVLTKKYRVAESSIVGLEVIPEHVEAVRGRHPGAHLYLLDGAEDALPKLLGAWAEHEPRFQVIASRHVMEHQAPGQVDAILAAAAKLLVPGGVYVQITPDWRNDPEPAHLTKLPVEWTQPRRRPNRTLGPTTIPGEPMAGGWPEKVTAAGLNVTECVRWRVPSHHMWCEYAVFAQKP